MVWPDVCFAGIGPFYYFQSLMEYRIATGQKIFFLFLAAAALFGGIYLLIHAVGNPIQTLSVFKLVTGIALIVVAVILYLEAIRQRLTIDEFSRSLTATNFYSSRTILLEEIEGYQYGAKEVFTIVLKNGGKTLRVPQGLGSRKELIAWIVERYDDLDVRWREMETGVLLENEQFGATAEDRQSRLESAKWIDKCSTIIAFVLFFWALIYPKPYELLMILLLALPWIGVFVTWRFNGLLKLYKKKSSPYPSVVFLLVFSILGLAIRSLFGYHLYEFPKSIWSLFLISTVLATIVVVGACWKAITGETRKTLILVCIVVLSGIYSFSALVFSNCYYDKSAPAVWRVEVLDKRISRGKSTSYYLTLSPWGRFEEGKEVTVSKSFFGGVNVRDSVNVYLKKGKWDLRWYWVGD